MIVTSAPTLSAQDTSLTYNRSVPLRKTTALSPLGSYCTATACTRSPAADLTALIIVSHVGGDVIRLVWRITSSRSGGLVTGVLALLRRSFICCSRGVVYVVSLEAYVGSGPVAVTDADVAAVAGGGVVAARSA